MEKLKLRYKDLMTALDTLDRAIYLFDTTSRQKFLIELRNPDDEKDLKAIINYDDLLKGLRDSLIQRFEYCVDSFWKYLKDYLEIVVGIDLETKGPRPIIREAGNARLMTEEHVEQGMLMIDCRNKTSHIYKEEIAAEIANQVHQFYKLMREISEKIKP